MNIRTRLRRWRIGADRYDYAVAVIRMAEHTPEKYRADLDAYMRANGYEWLIAEEDR